MTRHTHTHLLQACTSLLLLTLSGCIAAPFGSGVAVTTDGARTGQPATQGKVLIYTPPGPPAPQGAALIYGPPVSPAGDNSQQLVQAAATTWLQKRGLVMLSVARNAVLAEQAFRLSQGDTPLLRIGKLYGADLVVRPVLSADGNQVSLEAIDVEHGVIVWTGSALADVIAQQDPHLSGRYFGERREVRQPNPAMVRVLVCHALATAFGLEKPGRYDLYWTDAC